MGCREADSVEIRGATGEVRREEACTEDAEGKFCAPSADSLVCPNTHAVALRPTMSQLVAVSEAMWRDNLDSELVVEGGEPGIQPRGIRAEERAAAAAWDVAESAGFIPVGDVDVGQ
jgi:hypothetical protein